MEHLFAAYSEGVLIYQSGCQSVQWWREIMEPANARRWSAGISMLMKWEIKKKKNFISMAQMCVCVCGVSSTLFCNGCTLMSLNDGDGKWCVGLLL